MLVVLYFETDSEGFMLGILTWSLIVTDVLVETIHTWLVLNQDFNGLFPFELDSLAWRHLSSEVVYHFALGFWVFGWIHADVVIALHEIPTEFDSVVNPLIQGVLLDFEERTFYGSLKGTSPSYWLARVECPWRLNTEDLLYTLQEHRDPCTSTDHLNAMQRYVLCFQLLSDFDQDPLDLVEDRFWDLLELLPFHCVVQVILFHKILNTQVMLQIARENLSLLFDVLH